MKETKNHNLPNQPEHTARASRMTEPTRGVSRCRRLHFFVSAVFFIMVGLLLTFPLISDTVLAFTNGENAVDLLGQLDDENDDPVYTKTEADNGPNILGFNNPEGLAMDTSTHRLFVADTLNNRVLVYNLTTTNTLTDFTPDYVLGQSNFTSNAAANTQSGMNAPRFLAYDAAGSRLFVSQSGNHRVTVYDVSSITNGENAINVLGQTTFTGNNLGNTQAGMNLPIGLAYDASSTRLFVVNNTNNRVTVYDVSSITDGENAINVLGQSSFTSTTAATSQSGMNDPYGVAYDEINQRLFVSQFGNNRVTVYDVSSISDGENAINVLGQVNFTSSSAGNTQAGLNDPLGLAYDSANSYLYVVGFTNNRVTVYDVASISDGENAINVLGQSTFTANSAATTQSRMNDPYGLLFDSGSSRLYVSQTGNERVGIFDVSSIADGEDAISLIGQYDDTDATPVYSKTAANNGPNRWGLNTPREMALDTTNHRLFVSDTGNNRVLVYNLDNNNFLSNYVADYVLGQTNFASNTADTTQAGMNSPTGLAYDSVNNRLFVAQLNDRVTVYDVTSITNGENAVNVIGQANFTSAGGATSQSRMNDPYGIAYDSVNQRLFVTGYTNNRVTVYDVSTISDGENAINVLGQANFTSSTAAATQAGLNDPYGLAYDSANQRLFVSNDSYNRVTVYDVSSITDGENAINVLGQVNFTSTTAATTQSGLNDPRGLFYDSRNQRLFVTQTTANRVSIFDVSSISDGENAVGVLGQTSFTVGTLGNTQAGLNDPTGVVFDVTTTLLYVSQTSNHRISIFSEPLISIADATYTETNATGTSTFTVTLSAPASVTTTVDYNTAGGTAVTTTDYTGTSGTLTFTPGQTTSSISVPVVGDTLDEDDETFYINLSNATSSTISDSQATMTITDNDATPTVTLSVNNATLTTTTTSAIFTVTLSAASGKTVTVNFDFSGTATLNTDYTRSATSTTIAAGSTTGTITISSLADTLDEENETVIVDISSVTNATESGTQQQTVTLLDDDGPPTVTLSLSGSPMAENGGAATFTATLSTTSAKTVTVNLAFSGTAVSSTDYSFSSSSIIISAGSTTGTITVTSTDDVSDEDDETIIIDISSVTNGTESGTQQQTATITDDDTSATVTLSLSGSPMAENGGTATFTATLSTTTGSTVTVNLSFSGTAVSSTDYSFSSSSITIGAGSTTGTITVTGLNDSLDEANETIIIDISSVSGATESGSQQQTATITDDDTAGATLATSTLTVTEAGTTATYTIQLSSEPTGIVTITLSPTNSEVTLSTSSITFVTSSWNSPVTVTVTAVNDSEVEGTHSDSITHTASSSDSNFNGVSIASLTFSITDNDTASVTITTSTVALTEAGTTATYTIQLGAQPTSTVTVTISPDSQSTVSTSSIAFTTTTWNTPVTVTVTAVNDSVAEGTHSSTLTHSAAQSGGGAFEAISIASPVFTISDNDTAGVTITTSTMTITESGTTATYTIQLASQPTSTVTITLSNTNGEVTLSTSSIIFATSTWNSPVTVTVTATNDSQVESTHTDTITHTAASSDTNYNSISIASVTMTITDNDSASVTITTSTVSITEAGTTATYTIQLGAQPTSTVTISISSDSQSSVSTSSIAFTTSSWNTPVTVTVTAADDNTVEGSHTTTITHSASGGAFTNVSIASPVFTVSDNDTAGVTITEASGTAVTEGSTTDSYTIVLNTQPSTTVAIILAVGGSDITLSSTTILFATSSWNSAQTITVTAVDDTDIEGSHADTVTHTASSSDGNYNGLSISTVTVTITDNDSAPVEEVAEERPSGGGRAAPFPQPVIATPPATESAPPSTEPMSNSSVRLADGALFKTVTDPRVYLVKNGEKIWIPDEATFIALGYRWDQIQTVSSETFRATPTGQPFLSVKPTIASTPLIKPIIPDSFPQLTRSLSYGMVSLDVKILQQILGSLGFFPLDVQMTGRFGPTTKKAVEAFQRAHGISPIGIVGPQTRAQLGMILGW